jgi:hypothetical protein
LEPFVVDKNSISAIGKYLSHHFILYTSTLKSASGGRGGVTLIYSPCSFSLKIPADCMYSTPPPIAGQGIEFKDSY